MHRFGVALSTALIVFAGNWAGLVYAETNEHSGSSSNDPSTQERRTLPDLQKAMKENKNPSKEDLESWMADLSSLRDEAERKDPTDQTEEEKKTLEDILALQAQTSRLLKDLLDGGTSHPPTAQEDSNSESAKNEASAAAVDGSTHTGDGIAVEAAAPASDPISFVQTDSNSPASEKRTATIPNLRAATGGQTSIPPVIENPSPVNGAIPPAAPSSPNPPMASAAPLVASTTATVSLPAFGTTAPFGQMDPGFFNGLTTGNFASSFPSSGDSGGASEFAKGTPPAATANRELASIEGTSAMEDLGVSFSLRNNPVSTAGKNLSVSTDAKAGIAPAATNEAPAGRFESARIYEKAPIIVTVDNSPALAKGDTGQDGNFASSYDWGAKASDSVSNKFSEASFQPMPNVEKPQTEATPLGASANNDSDMSLASVAKSLWSEETMNSKAETSLVDTKPEKNEAGPFNGRVMKVLAYSPPEIPNIASAPAGSVLSGVLLARRGLSSTTNTSTLTSAPLLASESAGEKNLNKMLNFAGK